LVLYINVMTCSTNILPLHMLYVCSCQSIHSSNILGSVKKILFNFNTFCHTHGVCHTYGDLKLVNWNQARQRKLFSFTFIDASLGSFGNLMTEFESIERNICITWNSQSIVSFTWDMAFIIYILFDFSFFQHLRWCV
jgi:hypothetical protein